MGINGVFYAEYIAAPEHTSKGPGVNLRDVEFIVSPGDFCDFVVEISFPKDFAEPTHFFDGANGPAMLQDALLRATESAARRVDRMHGERLSRLGGRGE
jgi:hypothetical protein